MRLETSSYVVLGLEALVRADPLLGGLWPKKGSDIKLAWPSPEFDRLLAIVNDTEFPLRVSARLALSEDEERKVDLWEIQLDSFMTLTGAEERWRDGEWKRLGLASGSAAVRQFQQFRLSKKRSNNKKIVGMQGVLIFPSALAEEFQQIEACGANWAPITDLEAKSYWEGVKLLVPSKTIGPLVRDASVDSMVDSDGAELLVPRAWVIAFDRQQINEAADFNLTSDPIAGYGLGSIVVSRRIRKTIEVGKYGGVCFTPVLDAESALYAEFLVQWNALATQVGARKRNRLK